MINKQNSIFTQSLCNFIKSKEKEIASKIYITFGNNNVHLYKRNSKIETIGFVSYDGNFYENRSNMKKNKFSLNILEKE